MAGIIDVQDISFFSQTIAIVDGISYSFPEGKATALVGPSGCGKTTLLKLAAGLLVPGGGEVQFRGRDIFSMGRQETLDFRREAAFVFQDSALWANQSIRQILELPLLLHFPGMSQAERTNRIWEVLGEVGYRRDINIRPAQLSMGEQKLIAFARALMCRPRLLFLDEWTESLDERGAQVLIKLVEDHLEKSNTLIFVSHDFRLIRSLADYVVMIIGGKVSMTLSRDDIESDDDLARRIEKGITS
ncbi:MAG: ATP-binding cassette domain-containing protein [Treponema sp.]|nr:ATP-binding cassette domain-containing protein [Treponema sp.]